MEKQSFGPLVGLGRAAAFAATKVAPKILGAGWKAGVKPLGRFVMKHPGMALTGAFIPSSMSGYMTGARDKTLASLPRKLPSYGAKFASERGDDMSNDKKYPAIFYKLDGFKKMAAEAETAQRLVKKAFLGKLFKALGGDHIERILKAKTLDRLNRSIKTLPLSAKFGIPAGAAAFGGYEMHKHISNTNKVNDAYKDMLKIHPDLQKEDPRNVKQYFNYINTYSPTVAQNPHASGALVKRFVHSGGMLMDNSIIKSLLEVEKTKAETKAKDKGLLSRIGDIVPVL